MFFLSREDLNQLKILEEGLCAEINDAEKTVALTEEKCTAVTQRIPEIMELEKTEKERVTDFVYISTCTFLKKVAFCNIQELSNSCYFFTDSITDFAIETSN